MTLKELLNIEDVKQDVQIKLYLYVLLKKCGVKKEAILAGDYDEVIEMCTNKIIEFMER